MNTTLINHLKTLSQLFILYEKSEKNLPHIMQNDLIKNLVNGDFYSYKLVKDILENLITLKDNILDKNDIENTKNMLVLLACFHKNVKDNLQTVADSGEGKSNISVFTPAYHHETSLLAQHIISDIYDSGIRLARKLSQGFSWECLNKCVSFHKLI